MFQPFLAFTLLIIATPVAQSCRCLPSTLTAKFEDPRFMTIAKFCNNAPNPPNRVWGSRNDQTTRFEWNLTLDRVYKGDCSLKPGTVVTGFSGSGGSLCGAKVDSGCYILGLSARKSFSTCGLVYGLSKPREAFLAELSRNDRCKKGGSNGDDYIDC